MTVDTKKGSTQKLGRVKVLKIDGNYVKVVDHNGKEETCGSRHLLKTITATCGG